jgi:hypothetical protein
MPRPHPARCTHGQEGRDASGLFSHAFLGLLTVPSSLDALSAYIASQTALLARTKEDLARLKQLRQEQEVQHDMEDADRLSQVSLHPCYLSRARLAHTARLATRCPLVQFARHSCRESNSGYRLDPLLDLRRVLLPRVS